MFGITRIYLTNEEKQFRLEDVPNEEARERYRELRRAGWRATNIVKL